MNGSDAPSKAARPARSDRAAILQIVATPRGPPPASLEHGDADLPPMTHHPTNGRQNRRRRAMLSVAQSVFLEHGFAAASMSMIAALLGGSKGTLFKYFSSKEELFSASIRDACNKIRVADPEEELASEDCVEAELQHRGVRVLSHLCSPMTIDLFRVIVAEARRSPKLAAVFFESGPGYDKLGLSRCLAAAAAGGTLVIPDPDLAATQFIALCQGDVLLRLLLNLIPTPDRSTIEAHVSAAVRAFIAAHSAKNLVSTATTAAEPPPRCAAEPIASAQV